MTRHQELKAIEALYQHDKRAAFLEACKLVGRDPKSIKDFTTYMNAWIRAGRL